MSSNVYVLLVTHFHIFQLKQLTIFKNNFVALPGNLKPEMSAKSQQSKVVLLCGLRRNMGY